MWQAEDAVPLAEDDADREAAIARSGPPEGGHYDPVRLKPTLRSGGAVTTALAARLAPQVAQKRLSAATSLPHAEQRMDDM